MRKIATAVRKHISAARLLMSCFLILVSGFLWAQEKTVTGIVKNSADGSPVIKATVQVKGTKNFTTTDNKGAFSINANSNQTLVISSVGFNTIEKPVGSETVLDFELTSSATEMEGVVVTALGISRQQKALGYSAQRVMMCLLILEITSVISIRTILKALQC